VSSILSVNRPLFGLNCNWLQKIAKDLLGLTRPILLFCKEAVRILLWRWLFYFLRGACGLSILFRFCGNFVLLSFGV
jgi:hypothetical protein